MLLWKRVFAKNWNDAKREWELLTIFDSEGHCVCGHHICEHCVIFNRLTREELVVGNVCINHFNVNSLHVPKAARDCLKRIHDDVRSKANEDLREVAVRVHIINTWEEAKYSRLTTGKGSRTRFDIWHPDFDQEAADFRDKINVFIKLGFHPNRPRCRCGQFARPQKSARGYFYGCFNFGRGGCKFIQDAEHLLV
jgi:hypothetical protein